MQNTNQNSKERKMLGHWRKRKKPKSEVNNSARKQRSLIESFKNINTERSQKLLIKYKWKNQNLPKLYKLEKIGTIQTQELWKGEESTATHIDIIETVITKEDAELQHDNNNVTLDRIQQEKADEEIAARSNWRMQIRTAKKEKC